MASPRYSPSCSPTYSPTYSPGYLLGLLAHTYVRTYLQRRWSGWEKNMTLSDARARKPSKIAAKGLGAP